MRSSSRHLSAYSRLTEVGLVGSGASMLNRMALATSLAILSGLIYLLFYVLAVVWRDGLQFQRAEASVPPGCHH